MRKVSGKVLWQDGTVSILISLQNNIGGLYTFEVKDDSNIYVFIPSEKKTLYSGIDKIDIEDREYVYSVSNKKVEKIIYTVEVS